MNSVLAFVLVLGLVICSASATVFDRSEVIDVIGRYANKINALAKLAPVNCGDAPNAGLPAGAHDLVYSLYSPRHLKYFRTAAAGVTQLNFTVGGNFTFTGAPVPLPNATSLMDALVTFYTAIFTFAFYQPNHWLYSTPSIEFKFADPEFGYAPTATVELENESRSFVCQNGVRKFQMYFNLFRHVLCYENNPGFGNDGWKFCGFFEEHKGTILQDASLFEQQFP